MKFNVSSSTLLGALQSISKVIASKNPLPILDSFLFTLDGEELTITASDTETTLVTGISVVNVTETGNTEVFAIEAKMLIDPLKELPDQPLTFDINDKAMLVNVSYENGKFTLPLQDSDAYPQRKSLKSEAVTLQIESQSLLGSLNRTLFATAEDELRPVMNGIYFDIKTENITFASTDGHKLVRLRNNSVKLGQTASFILPKKPSNLLRSLLAKSTDTVVIVFDDNNACFKTSSFEMICRLIEGRFPNYDAVIPVDNPNIATIDRLTLLAALKRISVFTTEGTALIKIELTENNIVISAQDINFSKSGEEKVVCSYSGMPMNIGFKAPFLIDMLTNISGENILLKLADPTRAGVIVPAENDENEDLLMLIMPMMLND